MKWQEILDCISNHPRSSAILDVINSKSRTENEIIKSFLQNDTIRQLLLTWVKSLQNERSKCPIKANNYKRQANRAFKAKNYKESADMYTKCMQYASFESEDFFQAAAYRSASLFHLNKFEESLKDIELVMKWQCPPKMSFKLHRQAAQCFEMLNEKEHMLQHLIKAQESLKNCDDMLKTEKEESAESIKILMSNVSKLKSTSNTQSDLSISKIPDPAFGENSTFPFASSGLCIKVSADKGRYVVTNRNVKRGDILFVEKPFAFVLLDYTRINSFCAGCCSQICASIPCSSCADIVYCSINCKNDAWSNYHQWECPGSQINLWQQVGIAHLALNIFLTCATTSNIDRFNQIQSLVTNIDRLPASDLLLYSSTALMLTLYLQTYTNFFKTVCLEKNFICKFTNENVNINCDLSTSYGKEMYASTILFRYILQTICNGYAITGLNRGPYLSKVKTAQENRIATAMYPSASMSNHSCDPNIINSFCDQYIITKATRDIKSGEEVFNCYGLNFRRLTTKDRQEKLKSQYCFTCKCNACTDIKIQHFSERFTALKCSHCNGAFNQETSTCFDCGIASSIECDSYLEKAEELFKDLQVSIESYKIEDALNKSKQCLEIKRKYLYKHHESIGCILEFIGIIYFASGMYLESIKYLKERLEICAERFGNDSIEFATELDKLTDIYMEYLFPDNGDDDDINNCTYVDSDIYKATAKDTLTLINRAHEIFDELKGPWAPGYKRLVDKKLKLSIRFLVKN